MLFSQDGVDCLHKVFSALRRAEKGRQFVTSLDSRLDFISSGQAVICSVIEPPLAEILTCSTSEMSVLVFLLTPILCGQSHTQQSPRHLREKSSLMSHIRRNLVIYCEIIISRTEARTSVLLKFVIYYTCIGHRPDLKGISWDHVTESEGIFFFRRYRDPVGTSLQSSKEFFFFCFYRRKMVHRKGKSTMCLRLGFGVADGILFLWKPTIFFFCLDPSLQTKTTAVLNTRKHWWKKRLSNHWGSGHMSNQHM